MKYLAATTVLVLVLLLLALANTVIPVLVRNVLQVLP